MSDQKDLKPKYMLDATNSCEKISFSGAKFNELKPFFFVLQKKGSFSDEKLQHATWIQFEIVLWK